MNLSSGPNRGEESSSPQSPLLSVIVPVFNERPTIGEILRRVAAAPHRKEMVVVDDGSTDGTREYLERLVDQGHQLGDLQLRLHPRNRGKGAAVRTALQIAKGSIVLIQDADLEYDPHDYRALLEPILDGRADVVYGSRFGGEAQRVLYFWHFAGNKLLTLLSNLLTNVNLSDIEVGYKVFRKEVLDRIKIKSDGFAIEPELTVKLARQGLRIYEVPVSYSGRTYAEGKKITWVDGFKTVFALIRFRLVD